MSRDISSGDTQTIESGSTAYGTPINTAGQLNVAGQVNTTDTAESTASGVGEGVGTGTPTV